MITLREILIFFLIICFIFLWRAYKTYVPRVSIHSTEINSHNTVFAFDLHEVILTANIPKMFKYFFRKFPKKDLFFILINPSFWWYFILLAQRKISVGYFFEKFEDQYPSLINIRSNLASILALQDVNTKTIDLIRQLKKQNFSIFLASNIGELSLEVTLEDFPLLTTLFDGIFIPRASNNYTLKPQKEYFTALKEYITLKTREPKNIILIDNYAYNIQAAIKSGINTILFNNAEQVTRDLSQFINLYSTNKK